MEPGQAEVADREIGEGEGETGLFPALGEQGDIGVWLAGWRGALLCSRHTSPRFQPTAPASGGWLLKRLS